MNQINVAHAEPRVDVMAAALGYAERGWPVIPLHTPVSFGPKKASDVGSATCSCGQGGCESQGKHPRTSHGLADASTDSETVLGWWRRWPDANIGIVTGVGFDVLDLDGDEALDAFDALAPGAAPLTGPMVLTGIGVHIYMAASGAGNRTKVGGKVGVDWRSTGGYVVAPPSLHYLHGDRYEWSRKFGPESPLLSAPGWLDDLLHKRKSDRRVPSRGAANRRRGGAGQESLEREVGRLALTGEGERNDALNRAAFTLGGAVVRRELEAREVVNALLAVAVGVGLSEIEAAATIASGMSAAMSQPQMAKAS